MKKLSAKKKINFKFSDPVMSRFADFMVEQLVAINEQLSHHGVILEHHNDQFERVFEVLGSHSKKLETLTDAVAENTVDIQALKTVTSMHTEMIHEMKGDIHEMKGDMKTVKKNLSEVRQELKQKADIKDLDFLAV